MLSYFLFHNPFNYLDVNNIRVFDGENRSLLGGYLQRAQSVNVFLREFQTARIVRNLAYVGENGETTLVVKPHFAAALSGVVWVDQPYDQMDSWKRFLMKGTAHDCYKQGDSWFFVRYLPYSTYRIDFADPHDMIGFLQSFPQVFVCNIAQDRWWNQELFSIINMLII